MNYVGINLFKYEGIVEKYLYNILLYKHFDLY